MEEFKIGMKVRFPKNTTEMYVSPAVVGKTGTIVEFGSNDTKFGIVVDVNFGDGWVQFVPLSELEEI
jgi:hypothetical protein